MSLLRTGLTALVLLVSATAHADKPTVEELLDATDDVGRGEQAIAVIEMHVKTSRYERTMKMKSWSQGEDKTLIQILEPAKDAGISTLKVDDNIWNYLPKVDRTMKVPKGMMSGAWMGSHFTNDDLVKDSRLADEFTYQVTSEPAEDAGPEGVWTIELTPKPDAPVVWGKVEVRVRTDKLPVSVTYYDEKGTVARTMSFSDYKQFGDLTAPGVMRLEPGDKDDEFTEVRYVEMDLNAEVPESTFSLQALKK